MIASSSPSVLLLLLAGAAILGPCIFGIKFADRKRAYEHTERMKALDMGMVPAGDNAWPAAVCIAIGAVVPIVALGAAMVVTLVTQRSLPEDAAMIAWSNHAQFEEFHGIVWGCATAVGATGVLGGVLLAFRLLGGRRRSVGSNAADRYAANVGPKPSFDPDAYDTVSRRG